MSLSPLPYRACVGLAVFNHEGHVFIGERRDTPGAWQMPQGGIKKSEPLIDSAKRELLEEIGSDKAELIGACPQKLRYDFPDFAHAHKIYQGKYRGQEQIWLAFLFMGADSDIDISGTHYDEDPEFRAWRWASLKEACSLIVPFKRPIYETVAAHFADLATAIRQDAAAVLRVSGNIPMPDPA